MTVNEFERILDERKQTMRTMLSDVSDYRYKMDDLKQLIGETFSECTNDFEELCVKEGFQEVFNDWLLKQKGGAV